MKILGNNIILALFITLSLFLQGCDLDQKIEPEFKVYGDSDIINEITINVRTIIYGKYYPAYTDSKTQTLVYKGKQYSVQNNEEIGAYKIYFSYKDQVGELSFDNVYRPLNGNMGRINEIHIRKKDKGIFLQHFATTAYLEKKEGFKSNIGMSIDNFFKQYPTLSNEAKLDYQDRFYQFYDPNGQQFRRDSITPETIDFFKKLPLEQKKTYGIFSQDLEKMDLPENELKEILEYNKTHPIN